MTENMDLAKTHNFSAAYKTTASKLVTFQHYHDAYEIDFFINADLEIFIKDTKYKIHNGDIIFINEFDIHRFFYRDVTAEYNRYLINFKKEYILPNLEAAGIEHILDCLKDKKYTYAATTLKERIELESLFKSLINAYDSCSQTTSAKLSSAAVKSYLVLILIRIWEIISRYNPEINENKKSRLIQSIIQFIDTNYMTEITLDMLEERFYLSKFHISHIFKEVTGFSVLEYVQQRRIIEAQKMLMDPAHKIIDICFECGFKNIQNFYRVFKKISGITPDKYRKV